MDKFLREILTLNTDFVLKDVKIRIEEGYEIEEQLSNHHIFERIQKMFNLNYTLSEDNIYNVKGNNVIYLKLEIFIEIQKSTEVFIFYQN